ncbi:hypothetical protein B4U84_07960 [Westiellopsis prolifica IICB1]|nr:hypothetical protein B4U84_07960 [Westiellopsis prolifica IICB1]
MFKSILAIDFEEQEQEFVEALDFHPNRVAAFLIHGQEKYGQEILVTRLSQLRQLRNGRKIKIKLGGMGKISDLWNEIAKHFFESTQLVYICEE